MRNSTLRNLQEASHLLLLQGPIGSFFDHLASWLLAQGVSVSKINFNAGDAFFYKHSSAPYIDSVDEFADWLSDFCQQKQVDTIALFGEFRPLHQQALQVAVKLGLRVFVFEEGYFRPDYVTLEQNGVNANSLQSRDPKDYQSIEVVPFSPKKVRHNFWMLMIRVMTYYTVTQVMRWQFPHYQHHRSMNLWTESVAWWLSAGRKLYYYWSEKKVLTALYAKESSDQFFLVPLQVHNDSQVLHHSPYRSIEDMITEAIVSFAKHAPSDKKLVFKHHPMDRGYKNYRQHIQALSQEYNVTKRIVYIHDGNLPKLLEQACGCVTINSTVGLSALHHHVPVKLLGAAFYDIQGLVSSLSLDDFWQNPGWVDQSLFVNMKQKIIQNTQINMSFYVPSSYRYELGVCAQ